LRTAVESPLVTRLDDMCARADRDRDDVNRRWPLEHKVSLRHLGPVDEDRLVRRGVHGREVLVHELNSRARDVDRARVRGGHGREQHQPQRAQKQGTTECDDRHCVGALSAPRALTHVLLVERVAPDLPRELRPRSPLSCSPAHDPPHAHSCESLASRRCCHVLRKRSSADTARRNHALDANGTRRPRASSLVVRIEQDAEFRAVHIGHLTYASLWMKARRTDATVPDAVSVRALDAPMQRIRREARPTRLRSARTVAPRGRGARCRSPAPVSARWWWCRCPADR